MQEKISFFVSFISVFICILEQFLEKLSNKEWDEKKGKKR